MTANDPNLDKVVATIQKLMALSESSNQHEAEAAAAKAQALLQKYNLDRAAVLAAGQVAEDPVDQGEAFRWIGGRRNWNTWLAVGVANGYFCHNIGTVAYGWFIGRKHDREIALYVFSQLQARIHAMAFEAFKRMTADYKRRNGWTFRENWGREYQTERLRWLDSFKRGAASAISHRLSREQSNFLAANSSTALVPTTAIERRVKEITGGKVRKDRESRELDQGAVRAGYRAGESMAIHSGLPQTAPNKQIGS